MLKTLKFRLSPTTVSTTKIYGVIIRKSINTLYGDFV